MNTLRKLIGFIFVAAFALVSGAALGADKQYVLTVAASAALPQPAFKFTFDNQGNSSFNSLDLTLPSGWTISPAGGATADRGNVSINSARNVVTVSSINLPNGSGQKAYVTVTGVTVGSPVCGSGQSGDWTAQPWTGSSVGSGQKFKAIGTYPVSTSLPASCWTLTYTAGANGSIVGTSPQNVSTGGSGTAVTATPATNYRFVQWSDASTQNPRTDTNVQGNVSVSASFALLPKVTVTAGANGSISPGTGYVAYNSTNTYNINPSTNYRIDSVTVDGTPQSAPYPTSVTLSSITGDRSIAATFVANTLTVTPPATVYVGAAFNVTVTFDGPPPPSVTLSWTCTGAASGSQTKSAPPPLTSPLTFSVTLDKAGACTFKATAPNYMDGTFATKVDVYSGTLGCTFPSNKQGDLDPQALVTYVKKSDQGKWGLIRGNNKDATLCAVVPYTFELDVLSTPQQSKFIVPNSPQKVAVKYTVVWGRFDVIGDASNIWASKRPKMSWGIANPVTGTDDFVPALPCVLDPDNPDLAGTYPNGFTSVPTADLDKLLPVIPNLPPFNTFSATNRPQYMTGQKAKMCVAQQGWTATGSDATDPLDVSVDPATVQIWTSVIDQGDGFMNVE